MAVQQMTASLTDELAQAVILRKAAKFKLIQVIHVTKVGFLS